MARQEHSSSNGEGAYRQAGSGAGTNLKVERGGTDPAQSAEQTFSVVSLHLLGSKSRPTISCFGERFHDGQYSLVSFLFAVLLLTVPIVPSHL